MDGGLASLEARGLHACFDRLSLSRTLARGLFQHPIFCTQDPKGKVLCACFRLDYNPDAPDIVLPGTDPFIARQALEFCKQQHFVPVFVKGGDFGWEYCGRYRVEALTRNEVEINIHEQRAANREGTVSMVLFLQKEA